MIGKISGYIEKEKLKQEYEYDNEVVKYFEMLIDFDNYPGERMEILHDVSNKIITININGFEIQVPERRINERWEKNE